MSRSLRNRFAALAAAALCALAAGPPLAAQTPRVLLVGDSWANYLWNDRSLRESFAAHGHAEIVEVGAETTILGSEAREWIAPEMIALVTDELAAHPTIDIVQITLGGNDFLSGEGGGGWFVGISDPIALAESIAADVATVVDHVLALDPDYRVLLSLYDYPNFVDSLDGLFCLLYCCDLHDGMGEPGPLALNTAIVAMSDELAAIASTRPRVEVVAHWGEMQFAYGFPDEQPPIAPGTLLPPGDLALPSPIAAMSFGDDCIHLSGDGYAAVAENLWWSYYDWAFNGVFRDDFESGGIGAWGGES